MYQEIHKWKEIPIKIPHHPDETVDLYDFHKEDLPRLQIQLDYFLENGVQMFEKQDRNGISSPYSRMIGFFPEKESLILVPITFEEGIFGLERLTKSQIKNIQVAIEKRLDK